MEFQVRYLAIYFNNRLLWVVPDGKSSQEYSVNAGVPQGSILGSFLVSWCLITLVLLMWKWMGPFLRKNHLLRCWGLVCPLNWIGGSYIMSVAKTATKKTELNNGKTNKLPVAGNPILILHTILIWIQLQVIQSWFFILYTQVLLIYTQI